MSSNNKTSDKYDHLASFAKTWPTSSGLIWRRAENFRQQQVSLSYSLKLSLLLLLVSLFIYLQIFSVALVAVVGGKEVFNISSKSSIDNINKQQFKLDCQAGEQRYFNYESATKVWGSVNQQVRIRASLRLRCMEAPTNNTLKYLVEVLTVRPNFENGIEDTTSANNNDKEKISRNHQSINIKNNKQIRIFLDPSDSSVSPFGIGATKILQVKAQNGKVSVEARAEPVFEEVGEVISETATKVKRSVSGWISKTWGSVKDFFVNMFSSSEKNIVSRDQAFNENGIDIAGQCKANKGKTNNGLPIDDSVFDDLEPKYYIGASIDSLGTAYEFDDNKHDDDEAIISFFDDPKPISRSRAKRASGTTAIGKQGTKRTQKASQVDDYDRLLRLPFVLIQSRIGKIIEVRFSKEEADLSIKNFKRHLCDLFATNLDQNKSQTNEVTPIGQHTTKYLIDSSTNSSAIKQSLMKSTINNKDEQSKELVRAMAMVGMQSAASNGIADEFESFASVNSAVESRDPSTGSQGDSLSVLRSINSTNNIQLNSRTTITPNIEQMEVRVKQVQQISEGRMTGTAGQLGMSLIQRPSLSKLSHGVTAPDTPTRMGRSVGDKLKDPTSGQLEDIADLLKVSTSFSVQLVPLAKLGNFADMTLNEDVASDLLQVHRVKRSKDDESSSTLSKEMTAENSKKFHNGFADQKIDSRVGSNDSKKQVNERRNTDINSNSNNNNSTKVKRREPLVTRPADPQELQRTMQEWRQLESHLQFSSSNLLPESSGQDGKVERLEILRDQIHMRLNEELMINQLRRHGRPTSPDQQQVASAEVADSSSMPATKPQTDGAKLQPVATDKRNDLGLALTQIILDTGVTSKRKGSVYTIIEEVIELEMALEENLQEGSMSRLLRDTIRMDKLRAHCKSAIATLDEIRSQSARLEMKSPFDVDSSSSSLGEEKLSRIVGRLQNKNRKRLEQCKQVVQLILRISEREAADFMIELIDECNNRMLAGAKDEELGYGPTSKYYRNLRQLFIELMTNINRPSESLLDQLVARLHYKRLAQQQQTTDRESREKNSRRSSSNGGPVILVPQPEFVYVSKSNSPPLGGNQKYNKSLLREEDDYNNNDGAGSLVMTITSLASRPSIGRTKRVEIVDKLLSELKSSSCLLFNGPDLDILESMGNFHEPVDEIVGKVVNLARRCRHHDQYLIACIHGLQGQLGHSVSQRFFVEQLRSTNGSCTVKSEIVLTLINAILINDLKLIQATQSLNSLPANDLHSKTGLPLADRWPSSGLNQVDDVLLELVDKKNNVRAQDRKCLSQLVAYYMEKKGQLSNEITLKPSAEATINKRGSRARRRRGVINDNSFWDDAQCKRWSLSDASLAAAAAAAAAANGDNTTSLGSVFSLANDLVDEIDDNSIMVALANNRLPTSARSASSSRRAQQSQRLLEREAELPLLNGTTPATRNDASVTLRKRHKCSASKTFGPKNAEAIIKAEIVNDLVGSKDENKFLARFRLSTNFLGNRIDVGRMYLWHQKRTTRAHVNILGKSLWDTSHNCQDKAPYHLLYMPLFDFNLWLVKVSVGLRLQSEMGFFSNCDLQDMNRIGKRASSDDQPITTAANDLELYPTISVRASGEASAKFVVARAGMSLASQYGYQGSIRVSRQPESCMSIYSAHQPMNITFSSWFQLWDNDCHYWGSRNKAEPQATKWRLPARKPTAWLEEECLITANGGQAAATNGSSNLFNQVARYAQSVGL